MTKLSSVKFGNVLGPLRSKWLCKGLTDLCSPSASSLELGFKMAAFFFFFFLPSIFNDSVNKIRSSFFFFPFSSSSSSGFETSKNCGSKVDTARWNLILPIQSSLYLYLLHASIVSSRLVSILGCFQLGCQGDKDIPRERRWLRPTLHCPRNESPA